MEYIYELKNVVKKYGEGNGTIFALKNVELKIPKNKFVVILGSSGSGKSTILNLIGFMDYVSEGEILYNGKNITNLKKSQYTNLRATDVGFVFQGYNLINNLTALENVEFSTELTSGNKEDAVNALVSVGLEDRLNNFPAELSGGEQQRVSIARAIAKKPEVLLCDEPTGALDSETGSKVLEVIHNLYKEHKTTVILITHNVDIAKIGDIIIHLKNGEINGIEENCNPLAPSEVSW